MVSNPRATLHIRIGDAKGSASFTYEEMAKAFTEQANQPLRQEHFRPYMTTMAARILGSAVHAEQYFTDDEDLDYLYTTYGVGERGDSTALLIRGTEITAVTLEFEGENEASILLA